MTSTQDKEQGLTLVELIIGMAIGAVVAVLAVFMLINTFSAQSAVTSSTMATTRAHAISEAIDKAVRNAAAVRVVPYGTDGSELDIQRNDGVCESFRASPAKVEHRLGSGSWSDMSSYPPIALQVEKIGAPTPSPYFASPTPPAISYSFRLSDKSGSVDVQSVAGPRTAVGSSPSCP